MLFGIHGKMSKSFTFAQYMIVRIFLNKHYIKININRCWHWKFGLFFVCAIFLEYIQFCAFSGFLFHSQKNQICFDQRQGKLIKFIKYLFPPIFKRMINDDFLL